MHISWIEIWYFYRDVSGGGWIFQKLRKLSAAAANIFEWHIGGRCGSAARLTPLVLSHQASRCLIIYTLCNLFGASVLIMTFRTYEYNYKIATHSKTTRKIHSPTIRTTIRYAYIYSTFFSFHHSICLDNIHTGRATTRDTLSYYIVLL